MITLLASMAIVLCLALLSWRRGYQAGVHAMKQNRLIQVELAKAFDRGYQEGAAATGAADDPRNQQREL